MPKGTVIRYLEEEFCDLPRERQVEILIELTLPTTLKELPELIWMEVEVNWEFHSRPGRMYMDNGDPGYPDESESEIAYTVSLLSFDGGKTRHNDTKNVVCSTFEQIVEEIECVDFHDDYDGPDGDDE